MKLILRLNNTFGGCGIYDEQGQLVYNLKQKIISFGERYRFYDVNGSEVGLIKQAFIGGRFEFFSNGVQLAELRRNSGFNLLRKYVLSNYNWIIEGDFTGNLYSVKDESDNAVMEVEIKVGALPDVLEINIHDEKNILMCSMCAIALEIISTNRSTDRSSD